MSTNTGKKVRDSNFELLRVLSMFLIVVLHVGTHGISRYVEVSSFISGYTELLYYFIRSLAIVAVSVYVMISGYFLSKSKFKVSKLIKFFLEISFFSTVIYLVNVLVGNADFNALSLFKAFISVFSNEYWFVTVYFIVYALSPFLNQLIKQIPQKMYLNLLKVLFLVFCIWQFIYPIRVIGGHDGFGLIYFIFLYFLGGYINKYKFIFKDFSAKIYLMMYFVFAIINTVIYVFVTNYSGEGYLLTNINRLYQYNSPLVLVMSYCIFQFFHNIKIQSLIINLVAKYVFGIYLIHDHILIRDVLWGDFGIVETIISSNKFFFIINMLKYSFLIFVSCWILSFIITRIYNSVYKIVKLQVLKRCTKIIVEVNN